MRDEKIFHLSQEEFKRRISFDFKGCDTNLPITDKPALDSVLRGSKKLLHEDGDWLYSVYRSGKKRGHANVNV